MIWRPVPGFEDNYLVSNSGLIWSLKRKRQIKTQVSERGYEQFNYYKRGSGRGNRALGSLLVHRLVALAFILNAEGKPEVNHLNGVKIDNRVENLEWSTRPEQMQHALGMGLWGPRGESNSMAKLTEKQVLEIRAKYIPREYSMYKLGREYGVTAALINNILKRKAWSHI